MTPGYLSLIHGLVEKWSRLGTRELRNGTILIGNTPKINSNSYLHELYGPLCAIEIAGLEDTIGIKFPIGLVEFFKIHNGCNLFNDLIGIYGLKKAQKRTDTEIELSYPYDIIIPNLEYGKLSPSRRGIVIKRYTDGSIILAEPDDTVLRIADSNKLSIMHKWESVGDYIVREYNRVGVFFDQNGYIMIDKLDAIRLFQ